MTILITGAQSRLGQAIVADIGDQLLDILVLCIDIGSLIDPRQKP